MFIMILQGDRYKACIRLLNTDVDQNLKLAMNSVPGKFPPLAIPFDCAEIPRQYPDICHIL